MNSANEVRPFWRSRRGWIVTHFLCGIAAAAIGFGVLFLVSAESGTRFGPEIIAAASLAGLAPLMLYQSLALRKAVAPWAWILAWPVAAGPAPWIVAAELRAIVSEWGNDTVFAAWPAGAALAGLWGAGVQWLALRRHLGLVGWLAVGGSGLALGTLMIGLGFVASLLIFPLIWFAAVPIAFALYAALSWRALGPLI